MAWTRCSHAVRSSSKSLSGIHRVCFFGRDFGVLGLGLSGMGARVASSRRDDVAVALDRASMGAQRRL
jgi:hypothetical protein